MKILVFEYITGGGFCDKSLPESLAKEGLLMLNALVKDLSEISGCNLSILLDKRFAKHSLSGKKIIVQTTDNILDCFKNSLTDCDAVWLIAPETDNTLFYLCQLVEAENKLLLNSPSKIVKLTSDKWLTYQFLIKHRIPMVDTQLLKQFNFSNTCVIKARDGVGCEDIFLLESKEQLKQIKIRLQPLENYILQPFVKGENLSLSALFYQGKAQVFCLNRQIIRLEKQVFYLDGCEVNYQTFNPKLIDLATQIAQAFPELWGYVGIDLIQVGGSYLVLEINPRLTSSYAGIKKALGINPAAYVLELLNNKLPAIQPTKNQTITLTL